MTENGAQEAAVDERHSALHELLARLGEWRIRSPRATVFVMAILLVLPILLYFALAWFLTSARDGEMPPEAGLNLIAPDKPTQDGLARDINAATETERERIGTLAFVIDPFPYLMPLQRVAIPSGQAFAGSDTAARTAAYASVNDALRESGCADSADQIEARLVPNGDALRRAEDALVPMQIGAQGLNRVRYFYHMGLVQLCKDDMRQASNAFKSAREELERDQGPRPDDGAAAQYFFLSAAGERLAGAKLAVRGEGEEVELPDLPPVPATFGREPCAIGSYADGCPLFPWPPRRTALVELHSFLLNPSAPPGDYAASLAEARNGFGTLNARNYANVVAAHAKAGDYENIGGLLRQLHDVHRFTLEKDCDALGRMANLGWISGRLDDGEGSFACSKELPTSDGTLGSDLQRMRVWSEVRSYRNALKAGNFEALIARMRALDKAPPDSRAFLEQVRRELLQRLSTRLFNRAAALEKQGAGAVSTRESLLKLLRSEAFPWSTRLAAAVALQWGPLWWSIWWPLGLTLLLLIVERFLWHALAGYGLMFTRRHHVEKKAGDA